MRGPDRSVVGTIQKSSEGPLLAHQRTSSVPGKLPDLRTLTRVFC